MLVQLAGIQDPLAVHIGDDPVRPEIGAESRFGSDRDVYVLLSHSQQVHAVICVCYQDQVPVSTSELFMGSYHSSCAIFYTVWSYRVGSGRQIVQQVQSHIQQQRPWVCGFYTLSPPTESARRFHLRNGAEIWRVNPHTVNFRYSVPVQVL